MLYLSTDKTPSQRTKRRLRAEHDLTKVTGERVGSSFALTFEVRTTVLPLSFCPSERLNSRMKPSSVPTYNVEPLNSRMDICIKFTLTCYNVIIMGTEEQVVLVSPYRLLI